MNAPLTSVTYRFFNKSIKAAILLLFAVLTNSKVNAQTNWYYNGVGDLSLTSSWGSDASGTGSNPADFISNNSQYIIQNTNSITFSSSWIVSGTGTKVILGNPTSASAAITLTMAPGSTITVPTGTFDISLPSVGNHKIIYQNSSVLSLGNVFDPNLELVFDGNTLTTSTTKSFGNVSLINNSNINMAGAAPQIKNLFVEFGSTLAGPIGASSNFISIKSGGSVLINGTFRAGKNGGLGSTTSIFASAFTVTATAALTTSNIVNMTGASTATPPGFTVTGNSNAGIIVGSACVVTAGTGAFAANTYVRTVTSTNRFTSSVVATTVLAAATVRTTLYTVTCNSTAGLYQGAPISVFSGAGALATGTLVTSIISPTSFSISALPTTPIAAGTIFTVSPSAPSTTWSTIVFQDPTSNITLGPNSTIDFYRGTTGQVAEQTIDARSYANLTISNSTLNSNKVFSPGTINVSGTLTVNLIPPAIITTPTTQNLNLLPGAKLVINSASAFPTPTGTGKFTLQSNASGTASIGTLVTGASIVGNVTTQLYIEGGSRRYRFLSHPFTTAQALTQLTDNIDISGNTAGTTGQTGQIVGNGFTSTISNNPSAYYFNTLTTDGDLVDDAGWIPFTDATTNTWSRGQGIRTLIRGSKGQSGTLDGTNASPETVTIDMSGTVNTGNVTVDLITGGTGSTGGMNLVGNPYASPIDIGAVLFGVGTNIGSSFYLRNPRTGSYITVNPIPPSYMIPANTAVLVQAQTPTSL
ncbi:MAG: beta strand repeat-containing protein, partial [Saprospiraceae bacterium]